MPAGLMSRLLDRRMMRRPGGQAQCERRTGDQRPQRRARRQDHPGPSASRATASPQRDNKRSELKYRTLGRRWWRWRSGARRRDIQWRRRVRSLWPRRLPRSLDPASSDTVLLTAHRTNVAARARLSFLRTRNHAESRNDDRDDYQAYDRHSSPPLRHHAR